MSARDMILRMSLALLLATAAVPAARAADSNYASVHLGKLLLNFHAEPVLNEDVYAAGVTIGRELAVVRESILAVEADVTLPLGDGTTRLYGGWSHWSTGVYVVLRMGMEDMYAKARIGLLYEEIEIDEPGGYAKSDLGISPGFGIGLRVSPGVAVELEGAVLDERVGVVRGGVLVGF